MIMQYFYFGPIQNGGILRGVVLDSMTETGYQYNYCILQYVVWWAVHN